MTIHGLWGPLSLAFSDNTPPTSYHPSSYSRGKFRFVWPCMGIKFDGSSRFIAIFPTKNRDTRIPFMAPFGILHRFTGKKTVGAGEVLEMMHCSIFFAVLRSQGTHLLNDSWRLQIRSARRCCWEMEEIFYAGWWFGTMEFYDFPFSWEWNFIIPTDEVHDFSEG